MAATRLLIFISSVQEEFAQVRQDLKAFLLGDAALRRFVAGVFLFEDLPPNLCARQQTGHKEDKQDMSSATLKRDINRTNTTLKEQQGGQLPPNSP
jgi:hypothetical protein